MMIIVLFFIYGLVFGSFANVIISRMHSSEKIFLSWSHCPKCKQKINWRDNIPLLSFALLRGKCRNCKKKISWQYPIVELSVALIFAFVGYLCSVGAVGFMVAVLQALVFLCFVIIFVYDVKYMEIPMSVMWLSIVFLFIINILIDIDNGIFVISFWDSHFFLYSLSAFVAFSFFFGLSYISDEKWMGYGDAFVAIAIGLMLGPIGTFLALMVGFCVGAFVGLILVILGGKTMKTAVPFGPFLLFGLFIIFVIQNLWPSFIDLFI